MPTPPLPDGVAIAAIVSVWFNILGPQYEKTSEVLKTSEVWACFGK
jgi:hypothetical protein